MPEAVAEVTERRVRSCSMNYEVIVFTVFQFLCFVASSFLLHDEMLIDDVVWPIEFESFVSSQLRKKNKEGLLFSLFVEPFKLAY